MVNIVYVGECIYTFEGLSELFSLSFVDRFSICMLPPFSTKNSGFSASVCIRKSDVVILYPECSDLFRYAVLIRSNINSRNCIIVLSTKEVHDLLEIMCGYTLVFIEVRREPEYILDVIHKELTRPSCKIKKKTMMTDSEFRVVIMFRHGLTPSKIASSLNRSVKTISSQKLNAAKKLGVKNGYLRLPSFNFYHGVRNE